MIQLHILNRNFNYTIDVKKNQCIGYIFLLGERATDKINTKYNFLYYKLFNQFPIRIRPPNKNNFYVSHL